MTISQIEAFLVLASTLNFTKASLQLHTTQPNLSKIIVNLEGEVGAQLLNRSKRDVSLTPAGEAFRAEMQQMMEQYHKAVHRAREVDSGVHGSLVVGFIGTALIHLLPRVVSRFHQDYPDVRLDLMDHTYSRLMEALADNRVDVALLPDRALDRLPRCNKRFLFADSMCLVVHRQHPLAAEDVIDLSACREESFILLDPRTGQADHELVTGICLEQDFVPRVGYEANTLNNLMMMIECGVGVSILAGHMTHFATENLRFVPLKGYEQYFRVSCAWVREANPCIPHFLEVLEECVAQAV